MATATFEAGVARVFAFHFRWKDIMRWNRLLSKMVFTLLHENSLVKEQIGLILIMNLEKESLLSSKYLSKKTRCRRVHLRHDH